MRYSDHATYEDVAKRIGFKTQPRLPLHLQMTLETAVGPLGRPGAPVLAEDMGNYQISHVMQRRVRGGTFSLCNLQREYHCRDHNSHWTEVRSQTFLVFTGNDVCFPTANLRPHFGGKTWPRWQCRVDEDPDFNQKVNVISLVPEAVQLLLTHRVRDELKSNADLGVSMHGRNLIIYVAGYGHRWEDRSGSNLDALLSRRSRRRVVRSQEIALTDWPQFVRVAADMVSALRKAERETRLERPSLAELDLREARANGGPGYGILPREEVDRLLECPRPRRVSRPIRRAIKSKFSIMFRLIGGICTVVLSLLLGVFWLANFPGNRIVPLVLFGSLILVGLVLFAFPTWKRWRILSLIKRGHCVEARVIRVQQASMRLTVGQIKYPRYHAKLEYTVDGEEYQTDIPTFCDQSQRAAMLWESGESTQLLVSSRNPWRVFWIDGLVIG